MNNSFVFYATFLDTVDKLNAAGQTDLANKVLRAIIDVGIYGEYTGGDVLVESYLPTIQLNIENATKRYQAASHGGSKGGRKTTYDKDLIIELKKQGLTNADVATKVGCSAKTVSRYWNEWTQHGHNMDKTLCPVEATGHNYGQNMDTKLCPPQVAMGQNMDISETQVMSHEGSEGHNMDTTGTEDMSTPNYSVDFVF